MINLPKLDTVAKIAHEEWLQLQLDNGVTVKKTPWGDDLLLMWDQLSDKSKLYSAKTIQQVYDAIQKAAAMEAADGPDTD